MLFVGNNLPLRHAFLEQIDERFVIAAKHSRASTTAPSPWRRRLFFAVALLALMLAFGKAHALTCSATTAGPNGQNEAAIYQNICWLDLSAFALNSTSATKPTVLNQTLTLPDGSTFTFTLTLTPTGLGSCTTSKLGTTIFVSALPSFSGASLGTADYKGVSGKPAFLINAGTGSGCPTGSTSPTVTLSAMSLLNPDGSAGTFQLVAADAESTNKQVNGNSESISFQTDGSNWIQIDKIAPPNTSVLTVSGLNTASVSEAPSSSANSQAYIFGTGNPTIVTATLGLQGGQQGVAFGLASSSVTLNKVLAAPGRANASDQFVYQIATNGNSPSTIVTNQQTSTGSGATNNNTAPATLTEVFGGNLTLSESMASGSVTPLAAYASSYQCTTTNYPSTGPVTVTVASGSGTTFQLTNISPFFTSPTVRTQIYTCTFTNTPPANVSITKTDLNTTYMPGGAATYQIVVSNGPTGQAVTGAAVSDLLPKGLTIAAPGVTCASTSGGATCSGTATNGAAGTVGTNSLNILSGLTVNLPTGSSVTISVPVTYSANPANY